MSKVGKKPIELLATKVEIKDNTVFLQGPKAKFTHDLPSEILATVKDGFLLLTVKDDTRENRMLWGLHRALLANKVLGAQKDFEKKVKIVGLGYKAQLQGKRLVFSLGYSHKINYDLPEGVAVVVDKIGQNLIFKSTDKQLLGDACDAVRTFRPPEPYKGTGILVNDEVIIRKAGKTKAA